MNEFQTINPNSQNPMGGYRAPGGRFGTNEYGPDGRRLPGDRIRDGNVDALDRRKEDEMKRGGPMAQLHRQNAAAQRQGGVAAGASAGSAGLSFGAGMGSGSASAATTQPSVGAPKMSFRETVHPSNLIKSGYMDATGHFANSGTVTNASGQEEQRRTYTTPTSMQALEARFPGYSQMTPQERAATLRGNRSFNQVGRVVGGPAQVNPQTGRSWADLPPSYRPAKQNADGSVSVGGGTIYRGASATRNGQRVNMTPAQLAGGVRSVFPAVHPALAQAQGRSIAAAPQQAATPTQAVASTPSGSAARGSWARPAILSNVMRGVIPVRNNATPPMLNRADIPIQASNSVAPQIPAGMPANHWARPKTGAESAGRRVGSYLGRTTREDLEGLRNFTVRPVVQAGRAISNFARGAWAGIANPTPSAPQHEERPRWRPVERLVRR